MLVYRSVSCTCNVWCDVWLFSFAWPTLSKARIFDVIAKQTLQQTPKQIPHVFCRPESWRKERKETDRPATHRITSRADTVNYLRCTHILWRHCCVIACSSYHGRCLWAMVIRGNLRLTILFVAVLKVFWYFANFWHFSFWFVSHDSPV